jgi:hypothetical protein
MEIRFATNDDLAPLMRFIDEHWARGHVLSTSRSLMEWQHRGTDGRDYDYVIASEGDELLGVLGFIATSRFDPELASARTVWLALWKVRADAPNGTGLRMLTFLSKSVPHEALGTVGINAEVAKLYRALGYSVGSTRQRYTLHPARDDFSIVRVPPGAPRIASDCDLADAPRLRALDARGLRALGPLFAREWPEGAVPRKSARFFESRYLAHPFYRYEVHAVEREGEVCGLIATRLCEAAGSRSIRVVDGFLPPVALPGLAGALQRLLVERDAECADLFEHGLDGSAMARSGLLAVDPADGETVIPNYYEPLAQRNVRVDFAYRLRAGQRLIVFKADADQDRPNRIEEPCTTAARS